MNEDSWDRLLKIRTSGRDDTGSDRYKYPYEPTPYSVLERLGNSGEIGKKNTVLDYGCGKGRVDFFLSYQTGCNSIGIEYNERFYQTALRNQKKAVSSEKVCFVQQDAAAAASSNALIFFAFIEFCSPFPVSFILLRLQLWKPFASLQEHILSVQSQMYTHAHVKYT